MANLSPHAPAASPCIPCHNTKNQANRHAHFLEFPSESSLAAHLLEQLGPVAQTDGQISAIIAWTRSTRPRYANSSLEDGSPISVVEAWSRAMALAHDASALTPPQTELGKRVAANFLLALQNATKKPAK
jgi:hypothetical protein